MGDVKVKQSSLTKKDHENSLYMFYDQKGMLVAKINVFPSGNIFVWDAGSIFVNEGNHNVYVKDHQVHQKELKDE